jgi:putative membrane protein
MNAAIEAFVSGFPNFLISALVASLMVVVAAVVYVRLTPMKEIELLRKGNGSAGLALGGVIVGLTLPVASAVASSLTVFDIIIWGLVALLMQLFAFRMVDLVLRELPRRIEEDQAGAAIVLVAVKISGGLILAAALSDPVLWR